MSAPTTFQVWQAMTEANDPALKASPVSNIVRVQKVKAGIEITIGWGGDDIIAKLARGEVMGGLILVDKAAFDAAAKLLMPTATAAPSEPTCPECAGPLEPGGYRCQKCADKLLPLVLGIMHPEMKPAADETTPSGEE